MREKQTLLSTWQTPRSNIWHQISWQNASGPALRTINCRWDTKNRYFWLVLCIHHIVD